MLAAAAVGAATGAAAVVCLQRPATPGCADDRHRRARDDTDDAVQHLTLATYAEASGDGARVNAEVAAALVAAKAALRELSTDAAGVLTTGDLRRRPPAR